MQRRWANNGTNWPGEPNVQMISLSELLHETRLRVKPVEQRAKAWVLVGGVQELQQEPYGWTCCRLLEQSLSKLQPRQIL